MTGNEEAKRRATINVVMGDAFGPDWVTKFASAGGAALFAHPPKTVLVPSVTEVMALRVIVAALVTILAENQKANGGDRAQVWINRLAAICQEQIIDADITAHGNANVDKFRADAVEHVVSILADARVSDDSGNVN